MVMTAFAEIWTETIEQFTFCKMGVSMIWKFSLAISLMIRLNLLKYSYIICLEVQRFCSPFVVTLVRQNFNGNVSSNHFKPVHPFTFNIYKIVLTTKYSHSLHSEDIAKKLSQKTISFQNVQGILLYVSKMRRPYRGKDGNMKEGTFSNVLYIFIYPINAWRSRILITSLVFKRTFASWTSRMPVKTF